MASEYIDRREKLKEEGKVELPLSIDTKKYLIGNISFPDIAVVSPVLILSLISIFVLYKMGKLGQGTIILSLSPTFLLATLQMIKHDMRKNITFLQYGVIWRYKYNKRQKEFKYKKGEMDMTKNDHDQDIRKKLGIKNVYSGCYETVDSRLVKVIEVSPINLALMNSKEEGEIYDSYRTFLNELRMGGVQQSLISQPINLSKYLLYVDYNTSGEQNYAKRLLTNSYKKDIETIQKSRNMVTRKRYIEISEPIKNNDYEKALGELDRKTNLMLLKIENMLMGSSKLNAKVLNNDDLTKLMYTCLDYENSQAQGDFITSRTSKNIPIVMGEQSAKDMLEIIEKQLKESIY